MCFRNSHILALMKHAHTHMQANLTGLQVDQQYNVTVFASNGYGLGPSSSPQLIRTLDEGGILLNFSAWLGYI